MKSNKIIVFVAIFVIAVVGAMLLSQGGGDKTKALARSSGALTAAEKEFDFGTISMKKGSVSKIFELKNEGVEPILISKVYTSCMCTVAKITDAKSFTSGPYGMPGHGGGVSEASVEVKPGETIKVEAIFNPAAHGPSGVGLANRTIFLESNSTQTPKVELSFTATVTN